MTKEEAIIRLKEIAKQCKDVEKRYDADEAHCDADMILLEYINDEEIREAWHSVPKWYS